MSEIPMQIILVEDNEGDVFLVRRALSQNSVPYELRLARNGEDALRIVSEAGEGVRPDIFVLDLNLPRMGGGQVLEKIRSNPTFNDTPVIVLTSSDSARDRARALELGADRYLCKPTDLRSFMDLGRVIRDTALEWRHRAGASKPGDDQISH